MDPLGVLLQTMNPRIFYSDNYGLQAIWDMTAGLPRFVGDLVGALVTFHYKTSSSTPLLL